MHGMGISRGFLIITAVLCFYANAFGSAETKAVSLVEILDFQSSDKLQNTLIESKSTDMYYQSIPAFSPWFTEINSTLEYRLNIHEEFQGSGNPEVNTTSTFLTNRLDQRTPYGLNFRLQFDRELGNPELNGAFTQQFVRGSLSFSLLNDFLGRKSRHINSSNKSFKLRNEDNQRVIQCVDISKKYVDAFVASKKAIISQENLNELNGLYKRVSKAARLGAISKNDQTSMKVDINNLETQIISTKALFLDSALGLQNVSGFDLIKKDFQPPKNLSFNEDKKEKSLRHLTLLEEEIRLIKKQLAFTHLQNGKDVSFIAGAEARDLSAAVTNSSGERTLEFIGVQANWRFGDNNIKNRVQQLSAMLNLKQSELRNRRLSDIERLNSYKTDVEDLTEKLLTLKLTVKKSEKLEQSLLNKFKNGNARYFEFLTARNQVAQLENALLDTKALLWKRSTDLLFLTGQYNKVCGKKEG